MVGTSEIECGTSEIDPGHLRLTLSAQFLGDENSGNRPRGLFCEYGRFGGIM